MRDDKMLSELKILLFDTDRNSASVTKMALQQSGTNGCSYSMELKAAVDILKVNRFDIIMADFTGESVDAATRFVRQTRHLNTVDTNPPKIVALMDKGTPKILKQAVKAGVDSAWVKPLSPHMIRSKIRQLLNAPLPYIEANNYYGPDRRRVPLQEHFDGDDRRQDEVDAEDDAE